MLDPGVTSSGVSSAAIGFGGADEELRVVRPLVISYMGTTRSGLPPVVEELVGEAVRGRYAHDVLELRRAQLVKDIGRLTQLPRF